MKIKGVIEDLKFFLIKKKERMIVKIVKMYLGLSLVVLWTVWGQSLSDNSLIQLILLKIYRPLPM